MTIDADDAQRYVDPERWRALHQVKRLSWLARWRRGPAAQIRAMANLRAFAHAAAGPPTPLAREEDLAHHVCLSELMRSVDATDR